MKYIFLGALLLLTGCMGYSVATTCAEGGTCVYNTFYGIIFANVREPETEPTFEHFD